MPSPPPICVAPPTTEVSRRVPLVAVSLGLAWVAAVVSAGSAAAQTPAAEQGTAVPPPPTAAEGHDVEPPHQPMPRAAVPHDQDMDDAEDEPVTNSGASEGYTDDDAPSEAAEPAYSSDGDAAAPEFPSGSSGDAPATPRMLPPGDGALARDSGARHARGRDAFDGDACVDGFGGDLPTAPAAQNRRHRAPGTATPGTPSSTRGTATLKTTAPGTATPTTTAHHTRHRGRGRRGPGRRPRAEDRRRSRPGSPARSDSVGRPGRAPVSGRRRAGAGQCRRLAPRAPVLGRPGRPCSRSVRAHGRRRLRRRPCCAAPCTAPLVPVPVAPPAPPAPSGPAMGAHASSTVRRPGGAEAGRAPGQRGRRGPKRGAAAHAAARLRKAGRPPGGSGVGAPLRAVGRGRSRGHGAARPAGARTSSP